MLSCPRMYSVTKPEHSSTRQPELVISSVRGVLVQLSAQEVEVVESETLEIKGWCSNAKELADKASEAAACIANAHGGLVLLGIDDHPREKPKFSPCPHSDVTPEWIHQRICDLTTPVVECSVFDISDLIRDYAPPGSNALAIWVPKSKLMGGHLTTKGISKVRVGKECKPQYAAEDDRSRVEVPGLSLDAIATGSLQWAATQHSKRFRGGTIEHDPMDLLRQAGLVKRTGRSCDSGSEALSFAALLLFGTSEALTRYVPYFETHIITEAGTNTLKKNVVECLRELCYGHAPLLPSIVPNLKIETLRELVINAYVHRCYRSSGPVIIRTDAQAIEIENPGELPAGLNVESLIHCVPVYRNLLLAEATRFFALSDKIGQGIDIVYRDVLRGGLPFPEFESEHGRFTARIPTVESPAFREFIRKRSQALSSLDEIIVLRFLWAHETGTVAQLTMAMQRGRDFGSRALVEMVRKLLIESTDNGERYQLTPVVRNDIEKVFSEDQLTFRGLWG